MVQSSRLHEAVLRERLLTRFPPGGTAQESRDRRHSKDDRAEGKPRGGGDNDRWEMETTVDDARAQFEEDGIVFEED
jgi:hypothetical protein